MNATTVSPTTTILVADDEPPVLRVIQRILKRTGYEVIGVEDGQAAVDALAAHEGNVDMAILDVTMPRLSGVEAATQIRERDPSIKIMISSGYDAGTATSDAPPGVVSGFLQKPFTPDQLRSAVAELLNC